MYRIDKLMETGLLFVIVNVSANAMAVTTPVSLALDPY